MTFLFPFSHSQFISKFWRLFPQNIPRVSPLLTSPLCPAPITIAWDKPSSVTWIVLSPSCFCLCPSPFYTWQSKLTAPSFPEPVSQLQPKSRSQVTFWTYLQLPSPWLSVCGKLCFLEADAGDRLGGAGYLLGFNTPRKKWDATGWTKEREVKWSSPARLQAAHRSLEAHVACHSWLL